MTSTCVFAKMEYMNKQYYKNWASKNIEKLRSYSRKWRDNNKEKVKKIQHDYYIRNRENLLALKNRGTDEIGVMYNYKEPLKKFKNGFGYIGTVTYSQSGDKIQCHFCGKFYGALGIHINKIHKLSAKEYKQNTELMLSTALVGESVREARVKWCIKNAKKINPILKIEGSKKKEKPNEATRNKDNYDSLERRNKLGTCPDQLLDKITTLQKKLNRTPSTEEFAREYSDKYLHPIYMVFGSWKKALKQLELTSVDDQQKQKMTPDKLLQYLRDFYEKHDRTPQSSDFKRGLLPFKKAYYDNFGTLNEARFRAKVPLMIRSFDRGFYFKELPVEKVKRYENTFIEK